MDRCRVETEKWVETGMHIITITISYWGGWNKWQLGGKVKSYYIRRWFDGMVRKLRGSAESLLVKCMGYSGRTVWNVILCCKEQIYGDEKKIEEGGSRGHWEKNWKTFVGYCDLR